MSLDQVEVANVRHPGMFNAVDGPKYRDMASAMLRVLPSNGLGMTQKEIHRAVKPLLSQRLFPGGATSMWWSKTVQEDLEAKGAIARHDCKPVRWVKVDGSC